MGTKPVAWRVSGTYARYRVGVRRLLCRDHGFELEILIHRSYCVLIFDYSLLDHSSVAIRQIKLKLAANQIAADCHKSLLDPYIHPFMYPLLTLSSREPVARLLIDSAVRLLHNS